MRRLTGDTGNIANLSLTIPVRDMTFSPNSGLLALARADSRGASVALVEGPDYRTVHRMEGSGDHRAVAFSHDGHLLAAPDDDGTVELWDVSARVSAG